MFFLTTYGVLNITAGLERFLGSPSFRPKFKVHWSISLLGALGCLAVMILINAVATVVAVVIVITIFLWLERREMTAAWGDVRHGIWMAMVRAGLLRLRGVTVDPKNWRPHLLVFSGAPTKRWHLVDLAVSITHNRGLATVATVLPAEHVTNERMQSMEGVIHEYLQKRGVRALVRVTRGDDPFMASERLVESYGLGGLVPNTILLGANQKEENRLRFCRMIAQFNAAQRNVVIVRENAERGYGKRDRIDVWWGGLQHNGGLMTILAYLLRTSINWRGAQVRLKMVAQTEVAAEGCRTNLREVVEQTRTGADFEVMVADGRPFDQILRESSADADLVMLGIGEPKEDVAAFADYYALLQERTQGLPTTLLVLAAEDLAFGEVLIQRESMGSSREG